MDGDLHRVFAGTEVQIAPAQGGVRITPGDASLAPPVRRYLGAPFDLVGFAAFAATEPVLGPLVARLRGLRPPLAPDPFEALVTSITAQQISLQAAFAIRNRLIRAFGEPYGSVWAFPTRDRLALVDTAQLVAVGFSQRKAEYTVGLARSDLDLAALGGLPDEEVKARLVALPGIGDWTADWFLARHLARPEAWPAGDLGLRKAVRHFYDVTDPRVLKAQFSRFANLAAHYLLVGLRVLPA